mmetsp:Transcript_6797/g.16190  ORF Transcript_6797/g.16190 Transcript_6797/m.16190 type:complete len:247 (-) Transcript_6797:675-1415(-)
MLIYRLLQGVEPDPRRFEFRLPGGHLLRQVSVAFLSSFKLLLQHVTPIRKGLELPFDLFGLLLTNSLLVLVRLQAVQNEGQTTVESFDLLLGCFSCILLADLGPGLLLAPDSQLSILFLESPQLVVQCLLIEFGLLPGGSFLGGLLDKAGILPLEATNFLFLGFEGIHGPGLAKFCKLETLQELEHLLSHLSELLSVVTSLGFHSKTILLGGVLIGNEGFVSFDKLPHFGLELFVGFLCVLLGVDF